MIQPINDGGPAYPTPAGIQHNDGPTLRDYFAAAALEKASRGSDRSADEIAKRAFYIADAMIRAREAK
jgi:hypothetical protein